MEKKLFLILPVLLVITWATQAVGNPQYGKGPKLKCIKVSTAPVLDGKTKDWKEAPLIKVKVNPAVHGDKKNFTGVINIELRAVNHNEHIYFWVKWPDSTKDVSHKTMHWDIESDGYIEGNDREDRLALRFNMDESHEYCMLAGVEQVADIWHWKAFRSQSAGVAHDKIQFFSLKPIPLSKQKVSSSGKKFWMARLSDGGDKLYTSQRPIDNIGDTVPRYIVSKNAKGSVADVKTAARWSDGTWTLEFMRKMDTGNSDDIVFRRGMTYSAAVAAFNHVSDNHHSVGPFQFEIE